MIIELCWDTAFFGFKVGKIEADSNIDVMNTLNIAKMRGYKLVYIFSRDKLQISSTSDWLVSQLDGHILYSKKISCNNQIANIHHHILDYAKLQVNPAIYALTLQSGYLSRFYLDPYIPPDSFIRMYRLWVEKIHKAKSGLIFAFHHEQTPVGLITAESNRERSSISHLSVSSSFQGRGIASALLQYLEHTCIQKHIRTLTVKTQLSNLAARKLYEKNKYQYQSKSYVYHAHLA